MTNAWLDEDGYPTDATLQRIREWTPAASSRVLYFVQSLWHWRDLARKTGIDMPRQRDRMKSIEARMIDAKPGERFLRCVTGGRSGNEALIQALVENLTIWLTCWRLSTVGGLYIFQYPRFEYPPEDVK